MPEWLHLEALPPRESFLMVEGAVLGVVLGALLSGLTGWRSSKAKARRYAEELALEERRYAELSKQALESSRKLDLLVGALEFEGKSIEEQRNAAGELTGVRVFSTTANPSIHIDTHAEAETVRPPDPVPDTTEPV